jgi:hypothetical protein
MPAPCTTVTTPNIHLTINDVTITRDSQKWLMDTASRVPIQQYYHDKHKCSNEAFHSINWSAQQKVLTSYDSNDQQCILKFVHGWLPTYDRLYQEKQSPSPRCPLCHDILKTNIHLFHCKHGSQQQTVQEMYQEITTDTEMGQHIRTKNPRMPTTE